MPSNIHSSPQAQFPVEVRLEFRSARRKRRLAPFLLDKIRDFYEDDDQGLLPTTGVIRHIRWKDYEELERLLGEDPGLERYAFRTLKLAYSPNSSKLLYTMTGEVHASVRIGVAGSINRQLHDIRAKYSLPLQDGHAQETLVDQILSCGSMDIPNGGSTGKKEPDGHWVFTGNELRASCCFLEVTHARPYADIRQLALDLLKSTLGCPGMAIIIWFQHNHAGKKDINSNPEARSVDKTATFTLFKVGQRMENGSLRTGILDPYSERIIRDRGGSASGEVFSFTIEDMLGLANKRVYEALRNSTDPVVARTTTNILAKKIELSSADITAMFETGEELEKHAIIRASEGFQRTPNDYLDGPWFKFPRKSQTREPPEGSDSV